LRICDEIGEAELKGVSISQIMTQAYLNFENMTREDLIEQIVKYAYNKSVDGKGADRDINAKGSPKKDKQERGGSRQRSDYKDPEGKFTRMDVNLGSKQRMNPARLMGIINEVMNNSGVNFGKIEINTHSSAIDVDTRHAMEVANNLEGVQFGSRKIKVELSAQALGRNSRPPKPAGKGKFKGKKQGKGKTKGRRR
jgi:ATP-dependent RNA helicase DeaD